VSKVENFERFLIDGHLSHKDHRKRIKASKSSEISSRVLLNYLIRARKRL